MRGRLVIIAAAAIGALGGTAAALAATTFSVSAGAATTGTKVAVTATSGRVTLGAPAGIQVSCASSTVKGTTTVGGSRPGTAILVLTGATANFRTCGNYSVTGSGTWKFNASSGTTAGVSGKLAGFSLKVSGSSCTFTAAGTLSAAYTNSTRGLRLSGSVPASGVSGCFGLVNNGDKLPFDATYTLSADTSAFNPIRITSP